MIDRTHELPIRRQCQILEIGRSSYYYQAVPISQADVDLMRVIDEIHLKYPFYGSRKVRNELKARGIKVGRGHVRTLMRKMGIEALYQKPRLSKPNWFCSYPLLKASVWPSADSATRTSRGSVPAGSATPSQRATLKYFVIVALLFLLQALVGAATAHYRVEPGGFYGFDLPRWLPSHILRTWHLQLAIFWIATAYVAGGILLAPVIGGKEVRGQTTGVNILFWALVFYLWDFFVKKQTFTPTTIIQDALAGPYVHFWYVYLLVGLYLLTPIFRIIVVHADWKIIKYFFSVWFVGTGIVTEIPASL